MRKNKEPWKETKEDSESIIMLRQELKMEKTKRLEARLTEQELRLIEEKMKQCGIKNKSAFLRKMAIDGYLIQLDLSDVNVDFYIFIHCRFPP